MTYLKRTARPTLAADSPLRGQTVSSVVVTNIHVLRDPQFNVWDERAMERVFGSLKEWASNRRRITLILPEVPINSTLFNMPGFLRALLQYCDTAGCMSELTFWHNVGGTRIGNLCDTPIRLGDFSENVATVTIVGEDFFANDYNRRCPALLALLQAQLAPVTKIGETIDSFTDLDLETLLRGDLVTKSDNGFNSVRIIGMGPDGGVTLLDNPLALEMPF